MNITKTTVVTPSPIPQDLEPSEPTFTLRESQLRDLVAALAMHAGTSPAPPPEFARRHTDPQDCAAHRLLSLAEQTTSKAIATLRDRIAVPANVYLVDQAAPQTLALIAATCLRAASGASTISTQLVRLAEHLAKSSTTTSR